MAGQIPEYAAFPNLRSDLSRVERALLLEIEGYPDLTTIARHLFGGVPKLVRPTLTLMTAYMSGDAAHPVSERVISAATAIELTHVGSMCHDDVIDEADTRRARPSVSARWGNTMAILNGDFLLASASEIAAYLGVTEARVLSTTFRRLSTGQMIETRDLYNPARSVDSYLAAITGKTAAVLASACRLGALEAGADHETTDEAGRFGEQFGIAFQINDDLLDFTASSEALGKAAGKDVLQGVYTLPVLLAREQRPEIRELLEPPPTSERIRTLKELVCSSGALIQAARIAESYMSRAESILTDRMLPANAVEALVHFTRGMVMQLVSCGQTANAACA